MHIKINFMNIQHLINSKYIQAQGSAPTVDMLLQSRFMGMICLTFHTRVCKEHHRSLQTHICYTKL